MLFLQMEKTHPTNTDSFPYCPLFLPCNTSQEDEDSAASCWWTSCVLCCLFPLCYPCYLSRTARGRNQMRKKQALSNTVMKKRNERGQKAYRRSMPVEIGQGKVSSTMTSEQSTGTSGYATLLSRKGTLHSVQPKVQNTLVKVNDLNKADIFRAEFRTVFVSTSSAHRFLNIAKLSELIQLASSNDNVLSESLKVSGNRKKSFEVTNDNDSLLSGFSYDSSPRYNFSQNFPLLTEDSPDSKEKSSPSFNFPPKVLSLTEDSPVSIENSSHSYNFSRTYLLLAEDSQASREILLIKPEETSSTLNKNSEISFSFDSECSVEADQVVKHVGHVDVSELNFNCRVTVSVEADLSNLVSVDPIQLSSSYSRQLALTDLVVIMVGQEDMEVFKGLVKYMSRYWAGFFPVLLVEVAWEEQSRYNLVGTLSEVFCSVERLSVQGIEDGAGKIFSTIARMLSMKRVAGIE